MKSSLTVPSPQVGRITSSSSGRVESLSDLLGLELVNLLDSKKRLIRLLAVLADASNAPLRQILRQQMVEAIIHVEKLEFLTGACGNLPAPAENKAMAGLIKEATEHTALPDAALRAMKMICALQRIKHVDMAACGTAAAHARRLGDRHVAEILHQMVEDEKHSDHILTRRCLENADGQASEEPHSAAAFEGYVLRYFERRANMPRYEEDDRRGRYEGRSRGGQRSATMQERDEYGRFESNRGGRSRYDEDYDRGPSQRGSRYEDDEDRGYSQRRSRYDEDEDRGSWRSSREDDERFGGEEGRSRSGRHSAGMQERDEYGRFESSRGGRPSSRYEDEDDDYRRSSRRSSRSDDDERIGGYEGRSVGRRHSAEMQERDEYGRFESSRAGRSSSRYDEEDDDRRSSRVRSKYDDDRGSSRGRRGGEMVDSAGRHYTRDSWERAQEGRALGGQHSHGGR